MTERSSPIGPRWGIQSKLLFLLGFGAVILIAAASFGLYGLARISESSKLVTERELPLTRGIQEALVAMLNGKFAFDEALEVDDVSGIEAVRRQEANLRRAIVVFDTYLTAITWGSESDAFRKSDGGLNAAEWRRLGLEETLTIQRPAEAEVQLAGVANIYFGGFAANATRAIASHRKFLRLRAEGDLTAAEEARSESHAYAIRAERFSLLTTDALSEVSRRAGLSAAANAKRIGEIRRRIERNTFLVFVAGLGASLSVGILFTRRNLVRPLSSLIEAATRISGGELTYRAKVTQEDELGMLATVFNHMADRLAAYPLELRQEVKRRTEELERYLQENYESAKMLIRRDRELVAANAKLRESLQELDQVGKLLVRRDLELTEANARLQELDVVKSEFVSVAAHQLRTPLTGIRWSLATLREKESGPLNPEQTKITDGALRVTLGLIELINDLLNVARIEEGKFGLTLRRQALLPVLEELTRRFREAAAAKGIELALEAPAANLPVLNIDGEKIAMVLENLLDNAIKYTPPGGRVTLQVSKERTAVKVEVTDTGIGIPREQLHRVFSKFFRADNALTFQTAGSGLGLYVVKNIIEAHGGSVAVKSREGRGSAFSFTLPAAG